MLLNYFKVTFRLLFRNVMTSSINIIGLAVGLVTFLALWPYAEYELRSDKFHKDVERMGRISTDFKWTDDGENWNGFLGAFNNWGVGYQVATTFPEVEEISRIVAQTTFSKKVQGINRDFFVSTIDSLRNKNIFRADGAVIADKNLFSFFTIPLIAGDPAKVLNNPNTVALSESASRKYFGSTDIIGKTMFVNDTLPIMVTGVFENLPHNSHLRFDMVFSVVGKKGIDVSVWHGWDGYCYFKLKEGYNFNDLQTRLNARTDLYEFVKYGCAHCDLKPFVQPLDEIVFTNLRGNPFHSKSKYLLQSLSIVSFIVMLIGWINFITLSIHSLNQRMTELATRRVVGAGRRELLTQFLVESLTINVISILFALTMFQLLRGSMATWLGIYIPSWSEVSRFTLWITLAVFVFGILITAIYPLIVILKRSVKELYQKWTLNKLRPSVFNVSLVTFQYFLAVVLLIWIVISSLQLNYIMDKGVGIKTNGVLVLDAPVSISGYEDSNLATFINEIGRLNGVENVAPSYSLIGEPDVRGTTVQRVGSGNYVGVDTNGGVDEKFLPTFQIDLLAGRNFLPNNPADHQNILISTALAVRLNFATPEAAIGSRIVFPEIGSHEAEIIGVFPDYQFRPYLDPTAEHSRGVLLTYRDHLVPVYKPQKISVSLDMNHYNVALGEIEKLHRRIFPGDIFKSYLLDDKVGSQYHNEQIARNQISFFTFLAIGVACLGLFGLISNKAAQKIKDIGIRKVLGARLRHIWVLLLTTTASQVMVSIAIGIPVAYFLSYQYLQQFSERIELKWWYYALPIAVFITILLITVSWVILKAARQNPVEALKHE